MNRKAEELLANLTEARSAVAENRYRRFSPGQSNRSGVYDACRMGWEHNFYQGYYYDIPNALRLFVPDGNLTAWWMDGQSKSELVELFDRAIDYWTNFYGVSDAA